MRNTTPSFSRKAFQFIADVLVDLSEQQRANGGPLNATQTADFFARALADTNPRFNYDRFMRAATSKGSN